MGKLRVGLIGAGGRMGHEVAKVIETDRDLEVAQGLDRKGDGFFTLISDLNPENLDVVIDFSFPTLFNDVCAFCIEHKLPLVSGTTGITSENQKALTETSSVTPALWAPNMSLGVAFVHKMLENYSVIAKDFDFQIEEFHHIHKKDKPSGTALYLQEQLQKQVSNKAPEPLAIRGGGIFGVHKVWAMSEDETILLEHSALNRSVFARGAVRAAKWIVGKEAKLYTITDVLGF